MPCHRLALFLVAGLVTTAPAGSYAQAGQSSGTAQPAAGAVAAAPAPAAADTNPYALSEVTIPRAAKAGSVVSLLQGELKKARAQHKTPVLYIYNAGAPLTQFHELLADSRMKEAFRQMYVIEMNIGESRKALASANINVTGIPAFFALGPDGKGTGQTINAAAWGDDTPENMVPKLRGFFESIKPSRVDYMISPYDDDDRNGNRMPGSPGGLPMPGGMNPNF